MTASARIRALALALPEATERVSHGEASWFVRKAPQFVTMEITTTTIASRSGPRPHLGRRQIGSVVIRRGSSSPPYVGGRGWIGVYLDVPSADETEDEKFWNDVADVVEDAYRTVAPKTLIRKLDEDSP